MAGSVLPGEGIIVIDITLPRCGMINSDAESLGGTRVVPLVIMSIGGVERSR